MQFEFLPAFQGDCFLIHAGTKAKPVLILVDGGPGGTYNKHLKPRLMQLRDERELDEFTPLVINLVIVSHVDDDHINGIVELFRDIRKAKMNGDPPLFTVLGLWHNSFDEIIGNDEVNVATAQFGTASIAPVVADSESHEQFDAALILQSIAQGNELRDLANSDELQIPINNGFGGLIKSSPGKKTVRKIGGVSFTVIDWIGDSYAILFSHPKDYTPVCTTELGYMAGLADDFAKRNTKIIGLSVDRIGDHEGWAQDIKDVTGNEVNFPMIGDHDLKVAKLYNMLPADAGETSEGRTAANNATVRTVYIIGPDKLIKAMLIYPMSTGRNFDEVLRLLDSIQLTAKHSVATPVNWKQGEDCIIVPSLNDEAAREKFPGGWKTVKPYLRTVPQPVDEPQPVD